MEKIEIQKSIQEMEEDIQRLDAQIQLVKTKERTKRLAKLPFFTPFVKAVLLTAAILLVYAINWPN